MQKNRGKWPTTTIKQDNTRRVPVFRDDRPTVMVVGHERSGNHFMINSLAACYGYVGSPWVDLDYSFFSINYFKPSRVADILTMLGSKKTAAVIKSHHHPDFLKGQFDRVFSKIKIVYIYRNPVDVMISFWKLLHGMPWVEGPKVENPLVLARSEPCGQLMRYQIHQYPSMAHRWAAHVSSWLKLADSSNRVAAIAYEDLNHRFPEAIQALSEFMERKPLQIERPSRSRSVVNPGRLPPWITQHKPDREAIAAWCRKAGREVMEELGY